MHRRRSSVNFGGGKTFLPEKYAWKFNKNARIYMRFAGKINKIPEFYMTYAQKN